MCNLGGHKHLPKKIGTLKNYTCFLPCTAEATLSAKPNAQVNNSMMISDLHQLFKMLSENKNEFEMGGKKFKLNVKQTEIESMLSKSEKISDSNKESQQNATNSAHTDSQH